MAIVLIGVPGAGKSTVGKILAQQLGTTFIDTDSVIEQVAGKSISDIFIQDGEPHFRQLEKQIIAESLANNDAVISLGGGALMDPQTRTLVKEQNCYWLQAGLSQAVDRVGMNKNRPLLLGNVRGQLADLMAAREPLYIECAKHVVDTNQLTAEQVANHIFDEVRSD
jgi:shikimate kinase